MQSKKGGNHMIFKPKISKLKKVLQRVPLLFAALVCTLTINTLKTHATDDYDKWVQSIVDSQGVDSTEKTVEVPNGASTRRTGYLCYLLDKNGKEVPGTEAVAFKSPDFTYYPGKYEWIVKSRTGGYTADRFKDTPADWACTPWREEGKDNYLTNEPQIREWFKSEDKDSNMGGTQFVYATWGEDAADKYVDGEYFIVIETIMHLQFSKWKPGVIISTAQEGYDDLVDRYSAMSGRALVSEAPTNIQKAYDRGDIGESAVRTYILKALKKLYNSNPSAFEIKKPGEYQLLGEDLLVGTIPNLIEYRNTVLKSNTTVLNKFTHKIAPFAEFVCSGNIGEQLGFKAWTGSTSKQISDKDIFDYGVAMMVISADIPEQSTCDEPQLPIPHPAPTETSGSYTIIKNYRTKISDDNSLPPEVQYKDDGCYIRENISSKIRIEDEETYKVIAWQITSETPDAPNLDSIAWTPPGTPTRGGIITNQNALPTEAINLQSPNEKCLYLLLEKPQEEYHHQKLSHQAKNKG